MRPSVLKHVRMQFTIHWKYSVHAQCCHRGCYDRRSYFFKNGSSSIPCVGSKNTYLSELILRTYLSDSEKGQIGIVRRLCQSFSKTSTLMGRSWYLVVSTYQKMLQGRTNGEDCLRPHSELLWSPYLNTSKLFWQHEVDLHNIAQVVLMSWLLSVRSNCNVIFSINQLL